MKGYLTLRELEEITHELIKGTGLPKEILYKQNPHPTAIEVCCRIAEGTIKLKELQRKIWDMTFKFIEEMGNRIANKIMKEGSE